MNSRRFFPFFLLAVVALATVWTRTSANETPSAAKALAVTTPDKEKCVRRALLVGVDDYVEFPDLRFSGNDVDLMRDRLLELGFKPGDIVSLKDGSAAALAPTKRNIERELKRLFAAAGPEDIVFVMFSGHGFQKANYGGYKTYVGFAPTDATRGKDGPVDFETTVSTSKLFDDLQKCKAKFKWALVDACRESVGEKSLVDPNWAPMNAPAGVIAMQSCAAKEFSYEDAEKKHSVFVYYFAESLNVDADGDGFVTLLEAFQRAKRLTVERTTSDRRQFSQAQTPYCSGDFTDFVLTKAPPKEDEGTEPDETAKKGFDRYESTGARIAFTTITSITGPIGLAYVAYVGIANGQWWQMTLLCLHTYLGFTCFVYIMMAIKGVVEGIQLGVICDASGLAKLFVLGMGGYVLFGWGALTFVW